MRIAVVYESQSGNTKALAEEIYNSLEGEDKIICDIEKNPVPVADFYFIGFGIHNHNCSMRIANAMEEITSGGYALFMTSGLTPLDKYKNKIYKNLEVWLPENAEYVGMFMCQGKVTPAEGEELVSKNPESESIIIEMLQKGLTHPDEKDLADVKVFVQDVLAEWQN